MKKAVKIILILLILAACAAGGYYYMNLPLNVTAIQAAPRVAELYFMEQGVADVGRTVDVYAPISGRIAYLAVWEGKSVSEGDLLCLVDTSELSFQINQAQISIRSYQAQIDNLYLEEQRARDSLRANRSGLMGELRALDAQSSASNVVVGDQMRRRDEQIRLQNIVIEQNQKDLEKAFVDMSTSEALYNAGVISQHEHMFSANAVELQEDLLARNLQQLQIIMNSEIHGDNSGYYAAARESVRAQIQGIDSLLGNSYTAAMKEYFNTMIEGAHTTIEQLNKRIADSTVTAPVSGVITTLHIENINVLNIMSPVAIITPDTTNRIEVYISTNDINEIYIGQEVELILKRRGGDIMYAGTVIDIEKEAAVRFSPLGVEERRVKATIEPEAGAEGIYRGFDVDVRFVVFREEDRLTVPKTAFFVVDGRDMVWTIQEGRAVMSEVVKGRELRTEFIVESGLSPGDLIITDADNAGLREGANVTAD